MYKKVLYLELVLIIIFNLKMLNKTIILFLSIIIISCTTQKHLSTGEVIFKSPTEQGTILVSSAGYGSSRSESINSSELNAFNSIIFKGVPGSQYSLPLVEDEKKAKSEHSEFFNTFFTNGGYKAFLMETTPITEFNYHKGLANIKCLIKINVASLRREFETNNIIRKFGY